MVGGGIQTHTHDHGDKAVTLGAWKLQRASYLGEGDVGGESHGRRRFKVAAAMTWWLCAAVDFPEVVFGVFGDREWRAGEGGGKLEREMGRGRGRKKRGWNRRREEEKENIGKCPK